MELLRQETDEQHPMAATVVCQKLNDMEVACDRRTLTRDIQALNEYGYEVMTTMLSHEKAYYVEDRSFSVPELKILIDAVHAASFVTEKKTAELIRKIANLGGSHSAEILQSNMVYFNTRKHHNESIYYNVDYLENAIEQKKKVIFYYFDLNENGEKVYRNGHHHYVVEPIALVFNEDNYYMVCYSARHDNTANYRVDRMDAVEVIDEDICEKAIELRSSVNSSISAMLYTRRMRISRGILHDTKHTNWRTRCQPMRMCISQGSKLMYTTIDIPSWPITSTATQLFFGSTRLV